MVVATNWRERPGGNGWDRATWCAGANTDGVAALMEDAGVRHHVLCYPTRLHLMHTFMHR
jgi:hypothetical protein